MNLVVKVSHVLGDYFVVAYFHDATLTDTLLSIIIGHFVNEKNRAYYQLQFILLYGGLIQHGAFYLTVIKRLSS